ETANPGERGQGRQGGGWSGGKGSGHKKEHSTTRTVYMLERVGEKVQPKPIQVKVGISDGITTEITEGLNDGDEVIIGLNGSSAGPAAPTSNPFGGGIRMR